MSACDALSPSCSLSVCAQEMGVYTENSFMTEKANSVNVFVRLCQGARVKWQ